MPVLLESQTAVTSNQTEGLISTCIADTLRTSKPEYSQLCEKYYLRVCTNFGCMTLMMLMFAFCLFARSRNPTWCACHIHLVDCKLSSQALGALDACCSRI